MTPRQARFVEEYLVDLNASAAARRAGYSVRTAEWQGPQLLGKPHVAAAVAAKQAELSERTETTQGQVLADLKRLAAKAERAGEFSPSIRARELIGKHIGMFSDRVQLTGAGGGPLETVTRIEIVAVRPKQ